MTRKTLAAFAAAMTLALPASALALNNGMDVIVDGRMGTETRSIAVSVADLNLTSTHDARLADSRITRAAKQVCGWLNGSIQQPTREFRACYGAALGEARSDLDSLAQALRQG
jgi:UrcA family protein